MLRGQTWETPVSFCPNVSQATQPRNESARLGTAGETRRAPLRSGAGVTPIQSQMSLSRPTGHPRGAQLHPPQAASSSSYCRLNAYLSRFPSAGGSQTGGRWGQGSRGQRGEG